MFKRILIANRGEIALRVLRACREMGIETVAVFSEADRGSAYLELANEAYCIGPAKASESYLRYDRVISAAEIGNAQAIHPGYGFLSENAHFAEVCRSCQIEFIGPPHEAMALLGDKNAARALAKKVGVPVVPGSEGTVETEAEALRVAREIGYPVLIKAAAGGGGKGMRIAVNEHSLKSALQQAQQEAEAAFGNGAVYLEKYIEHPRHVEVQAIGDHYGNVVHLWERDCTIQRRHQKLIEESPAPNLPREVRQAICESAVKLLKAANYYNAGTVEFLVDRQFNFYFIEVNARIQVEHPVTEMVTGLDLIKLQIKVAAGEPLPFKQEDVEHRGVAIECRINAEDPERGFRPSPGRIERIFVPGGPGVRFDSHVYPGYVVSPHYDSMIGKLIVHRPTRAEAIAAMKSALEELRIEGIKTTVELSKAILSHPTFVDARADTTFVERTFLPSQQQEEKK
ncbi:Biotin carboxylase of acetyl-CoA carboxylase [Thermogutta terrifontis]|jgi:acetyl-CoA carboxylase biotin carboxylase subunit|uniref:Biotin carboxylase n=1 Tax=Thermogutta terrifontis TaxID=1331910 RepID=A0A286RCL9_9BACT|nr:acetyl-CoA carboxylase biotin carboxylase subunit [Thermogutta terrifontis]ASV73657.1 Biotin carboxylase of acetyl-CoA carboxylase [Thermogutta terrifontis]